MAWLARLDPLDVLVVCIGNVCRSPYIAASLRTALPDLTIASAGTAALLGEAPAPEVVRLLAERGMDGPFDPARKLTRRMIRDARLIVTGTRLQRVQLTSMRSGAGCKVFTLKELARVIDPADAGQGIDGVLARGAAMAQRLDEVDHDDDLADPYGLDAAAYATMAADADQALAVLVPALRRGMS